MKSKPVVSRQSKNNVLPAAYSKGNVSNTPGNEPSFKSKGLERLASVNRLNEIFKEPKSKSRKRKLGDKSATRQVILRNNRRDPSEGGAGPKGLGTERGKIVATVDTSFQCTSTPMGTFVEGAEECASANVEVREEAIAAAIEGPIILDGVSVSPKVAKPKRGRPRKQDSKPLAKVIKEGPDLIPQQVEEQKATSGESNGSKANDSDVLFDDSTHREPETKEGPIQKRKPKQIAPRKVTFDSSLQGNGDEVATLPVEMAPDTVESAVNKSVSRTKSLDTNKLDFKDSKKSKALRATTKKKNSKKNTATVSKKPKKTSPSNPPAKQKKSNKGASSRVSKKLPNSPHKILEYIKQSKGSLTKEVLLSLCAKGRDPIDLLASSV